MHPFSEEYPKTPRPVMETRDATVEPDEPYLVVMGSSFTFGAGVDRPYATHIAKMQECAVLNLSNPNAGVEGVESLPNFQRICAHAAGGVVEAFGAHMLSNRFYKVHPRRNDRFVAPTADLISLYPDVDFTEFCFTRHMLSALRHTDRDRFELVLAELQAKWLEAMGRISAAFVAPPVLLVPARIANSPLGAEPLFISREVLSAYPGRIVTWDGEARDAQAHAELAAALNPHLRYVRFKTQTGLEKIQARSKHSVA